MSQTTVAGYGIGVGYIPGFHSNDSICANHSMEGPDLVLGLAIPAFMELVTLCGDMLFSYLCPHCPPSHTLPSQDITLPLPGVLRPRPGLTGKE